jgi:type I restriction enzyme S subunit
MSMIGTIGSAMLINFEPTFCIKNVALLKPRKVEPPFLIQLINSPVFQRYLGENLDGGIQKFVSLGTLRQLAIPVPDEPEQRAIAEALSDVDGLLGGLDRLIAKKRDLKQAAMQQLLTGQTRLPGFHGEWKLTKLRQLVTADRFAIVDGPFGSQLKVDEYVESGVPVIEMEHLEDGVITSDLARCVTPKKFNDLKRSAVYPGDILISKTGSLGKLGILPATIECGLITSRLAKITLDPTKADRGFVFQFLLKLRRDGYWEQVSQGGTMQILGIGMLQNAPVPDIDPAEQTAIAEVLTEMDMELAGLEQRREKTRALKQAMMQELLTGKTRLV